MSGKPKLFLLDAGPVIGLHELGLWRELLSRADVLVPSVVAKKEVIFWDDGQGVGRPIDVLGLFDPVMRERIDPGEAEAITLLYSWEGNRPELCTADGAAVRTACLLGLADSIVSLEAILKRLGLGQRRLASRYTEKKMRRWIADGREMRMRGEGLVR
jgi:hypothetical protein